ncbi:NADH-quinone oxidoreductase subunit C [Maridesulfovibrio sp.]|uniref:NADH-quinone oxidoreductase subunit C n=1 Tax=Maridesulfovibrio sp. TaxID=2795000 RepID=UPI003BABDC1B
MSHHLNASLDSFDALLQYTDLEYTCDANKNTFVWCQLSRPEVLTEVVEKLTEYGARLCTITAYNKDKFTADGEMEIVYSFDINGVIFTLNLKLPPEVRTVPSIVGLFANADWHEREFAELYDLKLTGRPKPRRLFLDPTLDSGVMNRLVPLSSMMNGASSSMLWEKIFSETTTPDWAKEVE